MLIIIIHQYEYFSLNYYLVLENIILGINGECVHIILKVIKEFVSVVW